MDAWPAPPVRLAILVALVVVNLLLVMTDDFDDGLTVVDVELLIQMREMRLHGARRNVHLFANVRAGMPEYKQLQGFAFTAGQPEVLRQGLAGFFGALLCGLATFIEQASPLFGAGKLGEGIRADDEPYQQRGETKAVDVLGSQKPHVAGEDSPHFSNHPK